MSGSALLGVVFTLITCFATLETDSIIIIMISWQMEDQRPHEVIKVRRQDVFSLLDLAKAKLRPIHTQTVVYCHHWYPGGFWWQ